MDKVKEFTNSISYYGLGLSSDKLSELLGKIHSYILSRAQDGDPAGMENLASVPAEHRLKMRGKTGKAAKTKGFTWASVVETMGSKSSSAGGIVSSDYDFMKQMPSRVE